MPANTGPLDLSQYISGVTDRAYKDWGTADAQLAEAKKAYERAQGVADTVSGQALDTSKKYTGWSDADRAFWEGTYKPAMQEQMDFARGYTTPERMMANRAAAGATVGRTMQAGMDSATRNLQSYGIDPSSGRYAGLDAGLQAQKAAAQAAAMTKSDRDTEMLGQQYLSNAIATGANLPGQAVNEAGMAMTQGNTALNAQLAPANSYFNWSGTAPQWQGLGNDMYKQWANAANMETTAGQRANELQEQINARKAKETSGVGAAIGTGLGILGTVAGAYFGGPFGAMAGSKIGSSLGSTFSGTGETYEHGGLVRRYADGGEVEPDPWDWEESAEGEMEAGATPGVGGEMDDMGGGPDPRMVPPEASPSGGIETDDVTAQVNVGEFVVPKDVTNWLGEKFFQKLIEKSRQEMMGPQEAEPEEGPPQAMAMAPTWRSEGAMMGA